MSAAFSPAYDGRKTSFIFTAAHSGDWASADGGVEAVRFARLPASDLLMQDWRHRAGKGAWPRLTLSLCADRPAPLDKSRNFQSCRRHSLAAKIGQWDRSACLQGT